jgi:hypothetical protein
VVVNIFGLRATVLGGRVPCSNVALFLHHVDMGGSCYEAYSPLVYLSALAEAFVLSAAIVPLHQESWHLDRIFRPHVGIPLLKQGSLL